MDKRSFRQTVSGRGRARLVLTSAAASLLAAAPALAGGGQSKLSCEITENGGAASGAIVVLDGTMQIASGSCGKPLAVPAGEHVAVLTLDGALDAPEQRQPFKLEADKTAKLSADFATGRLEVRITSRGHDTAGMAVIRKDGRQIGTLGSGVEAHLSVGSYEVIARYRSQEKRFAQVSIEKNKASVLDASFE